MDTLSQGMFYVKLHALDILDTMIYSQFRRNRGNSAPRRIYMTEVKALTEDTFDTFATVIGEINEQPLGPPAIEQLRIDFYKGRYRGFLLYEALTLAGSAIVVDSYSAVHARKVLYLDEIYIREFFRKRGLGKVLLDHVIEYAKAEGYMRLEWLVEKNNLAAEAFYAQHKTDTDKNWYGMQL